MVRLHSAALRIAWKPAGSAPTQRPGAVSVVGSCASRCASQTQPIQGSFDSYSAAVISGGDLEAVAPIFGILGGAAAVGGFFLKWREHRRPARNEPREALALETADEMVRLKAMVDTGWLGILNYGQGWWEKPALADNYDELGRKGQEMVARSARIDTAFGPSSRAATAVRSATDAAEEVFNALDHIRRERIDYPQSEHAELQVREYFEEDRAKIAAARDRFALAQAEFAEAANTAH
jgi:hypothetical protein